MRIAFDSQNSWSALRRRVALAALVGALLLTGAAGRTVAGEKPVFEARSGLDIARAASNAWAQDAELVYVENDEDVNASGAAERWGYLFFSPSLNQSRVYSVRDGKILVAENLEIKFEAPPLAGDWIDSGRAIAAADEKLGGEFRRDHGGQLSTMLLMRGAFDDKDADQTTWTLVYTSPDGPSLFIMVDAVEGKVRRTWKG
jgi:hypothetical protein